MHVLFITSYYPSPNTPVTGIFFHDQAMALHEAGHKVGVIVTPRINITLEAVRRDGLSKLKAVTRETYFKDFPVYRMHWGWFPRPFPPLVTRFTGSAGVRAYEQYCQEHGQPDVIHAQNIFYGGSLASQIKARHGVPAVLTEHSTSYMEGLIIFPGQKPIIHQTLRTMNVRLVVGSRLAGNLREYEPEQSIDVVGNLVDTDFFTPNLEAAADGAFTFLAVGTLEKRKGYDVLLTAFEKAFRGQNVYLEIGGEGPLREELGEKFASISGQVKFLGRLTRSQVCEAMERNHVMVSSSYFETFGLSIAEAMACGKPVIATRSGGPEDFVTEDSGLLVAPGDVDAFAAAMVQLRQNYRQYDPARIRDFIVQRYSKAAYVAKLEASYRRAMESR